MTEQFKVFASCCMCGAEKTLTVNPIGYLQWKGKQALIQDALPELSKEDRELLISGTCGECWEKMFAGSDDDDE